MPRCRQCGKNWPEGYDVCPDDGMRISSIAVHTPAYSLSQAALAYAPQGDEELAPGSFAGEYQIERKIGEGGMGAVYGARHPLIGKRAAIKVIRRDLSSSHEAVDRFIREAQSVNQIGDPNIVDVFGFGRLSDGRSFFVMEWLQGESLRERLERPLAFPDSIEILETIAKALQAAHEAGVVHRDLKPDNVFLASHKGGKPEVKLLDFGLAKLSNAEEGGMNHTRTGVVMGTPLYLSPEQAKGQKVDTATDIYSLGAMAYEMCAGVVPFKADSAVEIMAMHISRPAVPLHQIAPWIPLDLDQLVLAMLEKDPRRRPQIGQIRQALAGCRTQATHVVNNKTMMLPPQWTPAPLTPASMMHYTPAAGATSGMTSGMTSGISAGASSSKRGLWIVLTALAVVGIGVGAAFALGGHKKANDQPAIASADPAIAVQADPTKVDPLKVDPTKADPAKADPAKADPAKADPAKADPAKADPAKADPAKADPVDPTKVDPTKVDPTKVDPTKVDPTKDPVKDPVKDSGHRARVGAVAITIDAKATVSIDGKVISRSSDRLVLDLPPGDHKIHAEAPHHKAADAIVHIEVGGRQAVRLSLPKITTVNSVPDPFAE